MPKFIIAVPIVAYATFERGGATDKETLEKFHEEISGITPPDPSEVKTEGYLGATETNPWGIKLAGSTMFAKAYRGDSQRDGIYWVVAKFREWAFERIGK